MGQLETAADPTLGAIEVGILVAVCLFGALCVQTVLYFTRFPWDPVLLKVLVFVVWALDLAHTVLICRSIYEVTVSDYAHPASLANELPTGLAIAGFLSGVIGPLQQAWFAYRVHRFSRRLTIPLISLALCAARLALSVALLALVLRVAEPGAGISVTTFSAPDGPGTVMEALLVLGAANDMLLVCALCYYLSRWRGEGVQRVNRLVTRLMYASIETGLLTSFCAIALVICFVKMRDNFVWVGLSVVLCKLFSNSLLFTLNTRRRSLHTPPPTGTVPKRRESGHTLHGASIEFKLEDAEDFLPTLGRHSHPPHAHPSDLQVDAELEAWIAKSTPPWSRTPSSLSPYAYAGASPRYTDASVDANSSLRTASPVEFAAPPQVHHR
ncbi:Glycoside hydrolase [Mycena chlorophos]|uniref:Glycoside hydrolase n=1 Tax=Mycena chlorophos TaxID=658473 RepID=A0A8H6SC57_MYCCL|nr:Glycoside hydrolase [Mycena chlorophos]